VIWCVTFNPALDVAYALEGSLAPGAIHRAAAAEVRAGGKGNNVARVVAELGDQPVTAVMPLGGPVGMAIEQSLVARGIAVLATRLDQSNRVCIAVVGGREVTEVRAPGPTMPLARLTELRDRLRERVGPADWVTLSGSLPPGCPPEMVGAWVEALGPRVRGIIADLSPEGLGAALAADVTAVVPNEDEWNAVQGSSPLVQASTHVIVTRGASGVDWTPPGGVARHFPAAPVQVRNPVGAGDAFLGGLVHGLSAGWEWERAIRWGVAVAGSSVETLGVADVRRERARFLMGQS
jgi:1-phosphofructokinase family hexose kinase